MKKKVKISVLLFCTFSMLLAGCDVASVSLINSRSAVNNHISRSAKLWTGTTLDSITVEDDNTEIVFAVDMEKGEVTFTIEDDNGEVYTLSKTEAGSTTDRYVIEEAGTYKFTEEGNQFSGSYDINWEQAEED